MPRSVYSPEDRERGLAALVIAGSSTRAADVTGIPAPTLREWRRENAERYAQLRHDLEPQVAKTIAAEAESIALKLSQREHALADALTADAIQSLKPAEVAATLRNISTSKALQIDKISSPLRERPSHVQHNTGIEELMGRMAKALGFTDSTAVEIPNDSLSLPSPSIDANVREQGQSSGVEPS